MASIEERLLAQAAWISGPRYAYGKDDAGYYADHPNHLLRKGFVLDEVPAHAILCCAVLGLVRLWINGGRVSGDELVGDWTNPQKVIYCRSWDVAPLLREGRNTVVAELGNGFYNPSPLRLFGRYNLRERLAETGTPKLLLALGTEGRDGQGLLLASDASWECAQGPLLFNNPYLGERWDLARPDALDERAWNQGNRLDLVVHEEKRRIEPSPVEPCRRNEELVPVRISDVPESMKEGASPDAFIVDFGTTLTGFAAFRFHAHAGDEVKICYAETADAEGRLQFAPNSAGLVGVTIPHAAPDGSDVVVDGGPGAPHDALELDTVLCREGENFFENAFTTHSFRYALVEGIAKSQLIEARSTAVHTALQKASSLEIGEAHLQQLLDAAIRTKLNNVHGVWEDCAREHLGYGGDMVALADSNLLLFDCEGLIRKTVRDMRNDQTARGGIPETAPFVGIQSMGTGAGEGPLLWQLAYPYLILKAWQYYGAEDLAETEWPYLEKMAGYLLERDPEELAGHCLGDHGSIETCPGRNGDWKGGTPDRLFTGWCAILWIAETISRLGRIAGKDVAAIEKTAKCLRQEICHRFRKADGSFAGRTQTFFSFAGALGLMEQKAAGDGLARAIEEEDGIVSCGIFGASLAWNLLHETGHDDVVERWLLRREAPSYSAMLASGDGVLTESFTGGFDSCNHAMFSSCAAWLVGALAGVRVADDAAGADHLVVSPYFSPSVPGVSLLLQTRMGAVRACWRRDAGRVSMELSVPSAARLDLVLPEGFSFEEAPSQEGVCTFSIQGQHIDI